MSKEKKITSNIMWGVSAMVGFIIAERIYDVAEKILSRKDVIDEIEYEELEEPE